MLSSQTKINQIEIQDNGNVQIRFDLRIVQGNTVISSKWHRTVVDRGVPVRAQIGAVNKHLAQLGYPEVSEEDIVKLEKYTDLAVELSPEPQHNTLP